MQNIITNQINKSQEKRITYAEFMSLALYNNKKGYYMKNRQKIGKGGDFYTSSNVNPIFAKIFAKTFLQLFSEQNLPLQLCEIGGGTGKFALDVLQEIHKLVPNTYERLTYCLIEESPYHRTIQQDLLQQHRQVKIFSSLAEMQQAFPRFSGIIFSNELLDAFPVHVVEKRNEILHEVFVTVDANGQLCELVDRCSDQRIEKWLSEFGPPLVDGQRVEVPLLMNEWLTNIAEWAEKAYIFTVDYGYTKADWTEPERRDGSLRGYYQQQLISNPLLHPGEMDLTTHIHLDALAEFGETLGLRTLYQLRQSEFLLQEGILTYLQDNHDTNPFSETSRQNRAIRSFLLNEGLANSFTVTLQAKIKP